MIHDDTMYTRPFFAYQNDGNPNDQAAGLSFLSISLIVSVSLLMLALVIYYSVLFYQIEQKIPRKLPYQWKELTYVTLSSQSQDSVASHRSSSSVRLTSSIEQGPEPKQEQQEKVILQPNKTKFLASSHQPGYSSTESVISDLRAWKSSFKPVVTAKFKLPKGLKRDIEDN